MSFKYQIFYNTAKNITKNGLQFWYDARHKNSYPGSGTTWFDTSGNAKNGILTNGPTFDTEGGGSIVFDRTNDYIALPVESFFHSASVTLEIWAKLDAISDTRHMLYVMWPGNSLEAWHTRAGIGNRFLEYTQNTATGQQQIQSATNIFQYSTWYQFVGSYDATSGIAKTFVNGVLSTTKSLGAISYSATSNRIGNGGLFFGELGGKVAIARRYNRALADDEVRQNYNAERWRFNI